MSLIAPAAIEPLTKEAEEESRNRRAGIVIAALVAIGALPAVLGWLILCAWLAQVWLEQLHGLREMVGF